MVPPARVRQARGHPCHVVREDDLQRAVVERQQPCAERTRARGVRQRHGHLPSTSASRAVVARPACVAGRHLAPAAVRPAVARG
eukprot:6197534-Prymnesium_polylepis.6